MKIGIIGLGLIGGSMALAFRDAGHEVYGLDGDDVVRQAKESGVIDGELVDIALPDVVWIATPPAACAEILLNGKAMGDLYRAPALLSLGDALHEGENEITVCLFTTLHNVIGPFHRPLGNVGNTFGGGYTNPDAAWLSVDTTKEDWEMHMEDFYPNWTDEYNVAPLGIRDAAIVIPLN